MGQTYLIVNQAKRQYLNPDAFGENSKRSGVFNGLHATALTLMAVNARPAFDHPLVGVWCGDPVSLVEDTADDWLRVKANFEDISPQAIAMLCFVGQNYADQLACRAVTDDRLFVDLITVVHTLGSASLERSIQRAFGPSWKSRYRDLYPKFGS